MTYNHEYHFPGTGEGNRIMSQKVTVSRGTVNYFRILLICFVCGVVSLVFFGMFIRPVISLSVDNQSSYENVTANGLNNISVIVNDFVEEEEDGEKSQQERRLENSSEKDAIIDLILQLRLEVEDKLTSSYMNTGSYLIRWLRARNWELEDAREMLLDHLEFRAEYDMDSVFESNLTFFEAEYPVYEDGTDYHGGPVVSMNLEDWDLRRITVGGYERNFLRYFYRMFERGVKLAENYHSKGANITQGMFILNLKNYSIAKHGCFSCLPLIGRILFGMEDNYPGWAHHIILINSSDLVGVVIDMFLPYISGEDRAMFHIYGVNKAEWQQKILSLTAAEQIRPEFGGTKIDM